ncbi:rhomboid-like protein 20 isoform X2 [Panicum miliaceum]|uniref:Rhomboid-like protein 20 isoform X2 n=1 Tax=Panicum miliaceum TaxID=4540 RepID=A0A3L6R2M2_PANMI|nr:rhomboid-like protein 20 isoform X2 [Panicum miliaceum]
MLGLLRQKRHPKGELLAVSLTGLTRLHSPALPEVAAAWQLAGRLAPSHASTNQTGPAQARSRSPPPPRRLPAMNGGLPGFHNAPASRAVVVAAALFSVPFGFRGRFLDLGLSYQASRSYAFFVNVYERLSIWRLITSLFAFSSTPELIFGAALLYYFRVFERQIGSNKYAVFIVFSTMVSVLLQILALGYLKVSGILAGLLYRLNTFGIRRLKFPEFVTSLFSRVSWPFSSNPYQGLPTTENDANISSHQDVHAATQDPTESSIAALVSMGFDRSSAVQALVMTNYDVNLASNILLEAQALQQ